MTKEERKARREQKEAQRKAQSIQMPSDEAKEQASSSIRNVIQNKELVTTPIEKPAAIAEKPLTFSDMLAEQRKAATKDKTDAEKMQKYYALTDVFSALGKMGGAAIGGAIGGDVLGSAPAVGEYKESRGYLDALEKTKAANDRLRALDDKEFQLALRDEERSYTQQQRKLDREWQAEQSRINREWQEAVANKNFEKKAELEKELLIMRQEYNKAIAELKAQQEKELKKIGLQTVQQQYDLYHPKRQLAFDNGTSIEITDSDYKGLSDFFIGKKWGENYVDADNLAIFLRENPKLVNDYLKMFGKGFIKDETKYNVAVEKDYNGKTPFPLHISQIPEGYISGGTSNTTDFDIMAFERK